MSVEFQKLVGHSMGLTFDCNMTNMRRFWKNSGRGLLLRIPLHVLEVLIG